MSYQNRMSGLLDDYMNVRTVPAMLSVAFVIASLYQFGGISQVSFPWIGYTIQASHSILASLGAFTVAFMSSDTKNFQYYETWEQVAIAAGPAVILGAQYVGVVNDLLMNIGDPLGHQVAFLLTIVSWSVAIQ